MTDITPKLFVPLTTEFYRAFASGIKTYELRGINHQFNERTVTKGKRVVLSRGYNTEDRLSGRVGDVRLFKSLSEAQNSDVWAKIIPGGKSEGKVCETLSLLQLNYERFIAFQVVLN